MSSIMYPGNPFVRVRLKKRSDSAQVHRIWGTLQSSALSSLDFLEGECPCTASSVVAKTSLQKLAIGVIKSFAAK